MAASQDDAVFVPTNRNIAQTPLRYAVFLKVCSVELSCHEMIYKQRFCDYDRLDGWFQIFCSSSDPLPCNDVIMDRAYFITS